MKLKSSMGRRLAARLPMMGAILGMMVVFGSLLFYLFLGGVGSLFGVASGLFLLILGIWYASNPFFRNERRNIKLRTEVDSFVVRVRELYAAAMEGDENQLLAVQGDMLESVDRMVAAARAGAASPLPASRPQGASAPSPEALGSAGAPGALAS